MNEDNCPNFQVNVIDKLSEIKFYIHDNSFNELKKAFIENDNFTTKNPKCTEKITKL
jgi:hypothetical protein